MDDYRKFLAQQILTEDKLVTYRLLSRALKVHVNTAKEMLFEFHKWQNDKRPGTLHATYLVYGTPKKAEEQDGDVEMTDSMSESGLPFSDEAPTHTLTLVQEEQLHEVLQQYEEVTSIHVYSLAPHPLKDLQLLADTARSVNNMSVVDESPGSVEVYGAISNPGVRKRERKGAMPKPAPVVKAEPKPLVKQEAKAVVEDEPKAAQPAPARETKAPVKTTKKGAAVPGLKRQSSSGIGQMFAKAAANPKKPAAKPTSETPSAPESPALSDEGEDDSEMLDVKPDTTEAGKARKTRQAELRRMMDESDEEPEAKVDSPVEELIEEEPSPPEPEPKAEEGPAEIVSSTGDGRKRGRRRVTKKKQVMDDQGYLVTIQEQGWESFSEDEAPPPSKAPKIEKAAPAAKGKKGAAKGQGNIMSFFSKK
ncbi:DNA polymerase subunit Cdc27 [Xylariales sp. AK1849]|nr:DNA polymerase subunit Cdc27 [Xylariales sp. AK1849]